MAPHDIWTTFGALVQERMEELFEDEPEEALEWLVDCLGSAEGADALLSGRGLTVSADQIGELCGMLELDADVVSALLAGASNEVLLHVTGMTLAGCPVTEEEPCPVCVSLHERHERARTGDERSDLETLALDVVGHIRSFDPSEAAAPERELTPVEHEIHHLLGELPHSARLRVLAAAYEEHERAADEPEPAMLQMFDALPSGCRALVGYLSRRPDGAASESELTRDLELDGASLRDMEQAFESAGRPARGGREPAVRRLVVGDEPRYQVSPALLAALRARRRG